MEMTHLDVNFADTLMCVPGIVVDGVEHVSQPVHVVLLVAVVLEAQVLSVAEQPEKARWQEERREEHHERQRAEQQQEDKNLNDP